MTWRAATVRWRERLWLASSWDHSIYEPHIEIGKQRHHAHRRLGGIDGGRLDAVCQQYGVSALFVFGSVARGESTSSSDIDLLYDLRPGTRLGWEMEDLADALGEIFGRPVDLVSRVALHPLLKAAVLDEARPIYAA